MTHPSPGTNTLGNPVAGYAHVQKAPLCLIVYAAGIVSVVGSVATGDKAAMLIAGSTGLLLTLLASAFHHLSVSDAGDRLAIRFGPTPLFGRTVAYSDIVKVEVGRTLILDGWGIHMSIRGGWVWNLWGRDCVVVHFRNGTLRIGTDDAVNLAAFLRDKASG